MTAEHTLVNGLIEALARAVQAGADPAAAATATGMRRAVWGMLTEQQRKRVIAAAVRRARGNAKTIEKSTG